MFCWFSVVVLSFLVLFLGFSDVFHNLSSIVVPILKWSIIVGGADNEGVGGPGGPGRDFPGPASGF